MRNANYKPLAGKLFGVRFAAMNKDSVKAAGGFLLFIVGIAVMLFITVLLSRGMVWVSEKATPWLITASEIAFAVCVFVLLPLCIFRETRPWAAIGFYYASYVFGATLWAFSCIVCVDLWGYGALFVGLVGWGWRSSGSGNRGSVHCPL